MPRPSPPPSPEDLLPRCCRRHVSVAQLVDHLVRDYACAGAERVTAQVDEALAATRFAGLAEETLEITELIARSQLELLTRTRADTARLDPEGHAPRPPSRTAGPAR